jgi:hypothetical protein
LIKSHIEISSAKGRDIKFMAKMTENIHAKIFHIFILSKTPNAQLMGKKLFVKILRNEKQQTVFCPYLIAC